MKLSLFELYLKFMTVMYFILFYLNLWLNICFLNNFVNTRGYPWIPANMKKIDGYHITDIRLIWIRVRSKYLFSG